MMCLIQDAKLQTFFKVYIIKNNNIFSCKYEK